MRRGVLAVYKMFLSPRAAVMNLKRSSNHFICAAISLLSIVLSMMAYLLLITLISVGMLMALPALGIM
jgi:hypothetical protein